MAFMPSIQCLWLLRQLTLFAWLYSLAHRKGTLYVQENVEKKLMFATDSYYFDGSTGLYIRAGSRRSSPATLQGFAGYFHRFKSHDVSRR